MHFICSGNREALNSMDAASSTAISLASATLTSLAAPHTSEIQTRTSAEPVENTRRVRPVGDADLQFPVVGRMSEVSYPDSLTVELQPANKRPLGEDEEFLTTYRFLTAKSELVVATVVEALVLA